MEMKPVLSGCACCGLSRRHFLASSCAACAGAVGVLAAARPVFAAKADGKPLIHVIYSLHAEVQPGPDWPNVGFDFRPVMESVNAALANGCPEFNFLSSTATGPEEAEAIVKGDSDTTAPILGYIVYQMNCWNRVVQTVAETGKPTLYVDFQFAGSGGFLVYTADFLRKRTPNVGFAASSRMDDVIAAVKCFKAAAAGGSPADFAAAVTKARRDTTPAPGDLACKEDPLTTLSPAECLEKMKASKILVVRDQEAKALDPRERRSAGLSSERLAAYRIGEFGQDRRDIVEITTVFRIPNQLDCSSLRGRDPNDAGFRIAFDDRRGPHVLAGNELHPDLPTLETAPRPRHDDLKHHGDLVGRTVVPGCTE